MMTEARQKRRRGRPDRADASAAALNGVDVDAVDAIATLREIAADKSAPASARVSAAKELLRLANGKPPEAADDVDALTLKALRMVRHD
jgi:hypothetical protein